MFLKSLKISNQEGLIRNIVFHPGLNLIVDETPINFLTKTEDCSTNDSEITTGNNVGKTTVLKLINFCLGGDAKDIYTDPENKKNEYLLVKEFLINTHVCVCLNLISSFNEENPEELIIERNFLPRNKAIRKINGEQKTSEEFECELTNQLFPDHYGKKPTFPQIISHNMRFKDLSLKNTLKILSPFTKDEEYETLYLFLLGCDFDKGDEKQNLISSIKLEKTFKKRLEAKQTYSTYKSELSLIEIDIVNLQNKKSLLWINPNFENDLQQLNEVKYKIKNYNSKISQLMLRKELVTEAIENINSSSANIDFAELNSLYSEVTNHFSDIQKTFEDLVNFHNKMIEEKSRYIAKDLPVLNKELSEYQRLVLELLEHKKLLKEKLSKSSTFEEIEKINIDLNNKYKLKGEYEAIISQIDIVDEKIKCLNKDLLHIDNELFSKDFEEKLQGQINKFNIHFTAISQELYAEQYALKFDKAENKQGQRLYKFSAFNRNFSDGKKQGEITCFDIAYTLFADEEEIPCYHFLLNDKKELMHNNQLEKIAELVQRKKDNVQFVASILKDKLPDALNKEEYFVVKLSQQEKLFRIEKILD
ncbi:DUF2326 domain-containing protein [Gilliamella sp. B2776]|uniref:DUF2326 domain-containing protein n=1 Tax=unclassified Gilliamella TaxID=2685620 RepID=UPI00226A3B3D|nr:MULTISPECIES: DUF2326 domain-containing protein [unclassified Gilliamella]MCX8650124.1 DUF2326 domain-containing protein [Gilliamella sp. B2779]MCX8653529.1 DUF2326 domain-containing protein [Gilliamella sp. B2737]MCX8692005.1 DUF2326 domain-containing protein [Gilliamella sp. B2776]MCX8703163.1 DUF2326 domain-containing protein [Gilliamella sp. B2781]WDM19790.1 DUF2326 domain-containing protein [Gilliamella sp. B3022]